MITMNMTNAMPLHRLPSALRRRQLGVALFVCLMLLLILSLLGISALRMLSGQTLIASSSQASDMAFQAAETSISMAIADVSNSVAGALPTTPGSAGMVTRCVSMGSATTAAGSSCGTMDAKGATTATVTVTIPDTDTTTTAQKQAALLAQALAPKAGGNERTLSLTFTGTGSVSALGVSATNQQQALYQYTQLQ